MTSRCARSLPGRSLISAASTARRAQSRRAPARCGAAPRPRAAARAAPHPRTPANDPAGQPSQQAARRSGRADATTRPVIMPSSHAAPIAPGHSHRPASATPQARCGWWRTPRPSRAPSRTRRPRDRFAADGRAKDDGHDGHEVHGHRRTSRSARAARVANAAAVPGIPRRPPRAGSARQTMIRWRPRCQTGTTASAQQSGLKGRVGEFVADGVGVPRNGSKVACSTPTMNSLDWPVSQPARKLARRLLPAHAADARSAAGSTARPPCRFSSRGRSRCAARWPAPVAGSRSGRLRRRPLLRGSESRR